MAEHTPGPWRPGHVDHWERGEKVAVRAEEVDDQPYIAFLPDLDGKVMANAQLIAAAPDLLNACDVLVKCFESPDDHFPEVLDAALAAGRAAIAKAEGR